MDIEKLAYFEVEADVIEEKCKGITFVFTTLKRTDQIIGTLFAADGDPYALRIRELDGTEHKISTPVDVYPTMGLITYRNSYKINNFFSDRRSK